MSTNVTARRGAPATPRTHPVTPQVAVPLKSKEVKVLVISSKGVSVVYK